MSGSVLVSVLGKNSVISLVEPGHMIIWANEILSKEIFTLYIKNTFSGEVTGSC